MNLIDTHCHIHDDEYFKDADMAVQSAIDSDVHKMICIGTDAASSQQAIELAEKYDAVFAAVAVHPHDADSKSGDMQKIRTLSQNKRVIAIGECGLDYYYDNSDRTAQKKLLVQHFELAEEQNLPMSFHIRGSKDNPYDAFDDFWPIFEQFSAIRGVVHSFTGDIKLMNQIIDHGLFIALNGIITFSKQADQLAMAAAVPLEKLVLETDAPFLTPVPIRGTINEPKNVRHVARFLSEHRNQDFESICNVTTKNAEILFSI